MTKFIAIVSGKGGVGKTVTAINLGVALTKLGRNVIVVDGNLTAPHIGLSLGKANPDIDLHDVLAGRKEIHESIYVHPSGVKVIPADISAEETKNLDYERLGSVLYRLAGRADMVIIDSATGLSDIAIKIMRAADEVLVVTNPELHAVTDALRTIKLAEHHGAKVLGVVLARVRNDEFEMDAKSIESMLSAKILAVIPEDNAVKHSIKLRHPVVYTHPNSEASIGYKKLAARMLGQRYEILEKIKKEKKPFFRAVKERFGL